MSANSDTFSQWLNTELTDRGWSFRELSRRSGISTTHISEMANDRRAVGFDSCVSIARAFGLPPEQVLRRAGKLPPQPPAVTEEKEAVALLRTLPAATRTIALNIIRERQRRQRAPYHRKGAGPLTGVAYCNRCQRPMTRARSSRQWHLRCTTESHHAHTDRRCHPNNLPESAALRALAQHLQQLITPASLDRALAHIQHPAGHQRLTTDLKRALFSIENITAQRQRLALALAAGHMAPDIYHTADTQLLAQLHTAEKQAAELQRTLDSLPDLAQQKKALAALANAFPQLLHTAEPAELSTLLQTAGIRIYCDSGAILRIIP